MPDAPIASFGANDAPDPCEAVAAAIRETLARGLPQDESVSAFIATTYGEPTPSELQALLDRRGTGDETDSAAAETLVALLFFPDISVRRALEPILSRAALTPARAEALADDLADSPRRVTALLATGQRLTLAARPEDVRAFIARLRPAHTAPAQLRALLSLSVDDGQALDALVRLRRCRLAWTGPQLHFVSSLLVRPRGEAALDAALLDWSLGFLDALPPDEPPLQGLGRRHRDLIGQLKRAEGFARALAKSNFETLSLQGVRMPHLHADSLRRELVLLDLASLAVAGRFAADVSGVAEIDLGTFEEPDAMAALWNALRD